jgi:hypothetical protein
MNKYNAAVDAIFATWDVPGSPGCALVVAEDGTLVYSRGYGYADLDYDIPITPPTLSTHEHAEFAADFFSPELDATYHFALVFEKGGG